VKVGSASERADDQSIKPNIRSPGTVSPVSVMHEFSLYGQVSNDGHHRVIQQLAGYTRMQPQATQEIHVVFRARAPAGLDKIPSAGGSQGVMQQEAQKYRNMLSASLYYVQLVGEVSSSMHITPRGKRGDVEMRDDPVQAKPGQKVIKWSLDFRDTPDPGKQVVSTRLVFKTPVEEGDLATFMDHFGYECVSLLQGFRSLISLKICVALHGQGHQVLRP